MACRDPVLRVAAGLSWWMTEKLTLRSATAHTLISFFFTESGDNKHMARNDAAKLWNLMWPSTVAFEGVHPNRRKNKAKYKSQPWAGWYDDIVITT